MRVTFYPQNLRKSALSMRRNVNSAATMSKKSNRCVNSCKLSMRSFRNKTIAIE